MKTSLTIKILFNTMSVVAASFLALSCQRMQFAEIAKIETQSSLASPDIPIDEPDIPVVVPPPVVVVPPPPTIPQPKLSNGPCAADSSTVLTTCQKCNVPLNPPALPQFSQKGQSLIDIMSIACSVNNKSAPKNYVPPTKSELISRLNRLSPLLYPDSTMSGFQVSTIEGLKTNPALQQKMFGGRWYQPPYSDAFETYFGLEVAEVVYQICYQDPASIFNPYNSTPLVSYCQVQGQGNCRDNALYAQANVYRNNLRSGMRESINNPYVSPKPTPSKTCAWEKFEGLYSEGGAEQIGKWLVTSQTISMEVTGVGGRCSRVDSLPAGNQIPTSEVILSAYICK